MYFPIQLQLGDNSTELALVGVLATAMSVLVWTIKKVLAFSEKLTDTVDKNLKNLSLNQEKITEALTKIINRLDVWEERRMTGTLNIERK